MEETVPRAAGIFHLLGVNKDGVGAGTSLPEMRLPSPEGPVGGFVLDRSAIVWLVDEDRVVLDALGTKAHRRRSKGHSTFKMTFYSSREVVGGGGGGGEGGAGGGGGSSHG